MHSDSLITQLINERTTTFVILDTLSVCSVDYRDMFIPSGNQSQRLLILINKLNSNHFNCFSIFYLFLFFIDSFVYIITTAPTGINVVLFIVQKWLSFRTSNKTQSIIIIFFVFCFRCANRRFMNHLHFIIHTKPEAEWKRTENEFIDCTQTPIPSISHFFVSFLLNEFSNGNYNKTMVRQVHTCRDMILQHILSQI